MDVSCEHCGRRYQVQPKMSGRAVKCKVCGHQFTIPHAESSPLQESAANMPIETGVPSPITSATNDAPNNNFPTASEGPSDKVMRLVAGGMIIGSMLLLGLNHATAVMNDEVYLFALALGPFALTLGIAGLISPNVLRAAGKHGKHLPLGYKSTAAAFGLAGLLLCLLLVFVVYPLGR